VSSDDEKKRDQAQDQAASSFGNEVREAIGILGDSLKAVLFSMCERTLLYRGPSNAAMNRDNNLPSFRFAHRAPLKEQRSNHGFGR
jgi:hypothetical protein